MLDRIEVTLTFRNSTKNKNRYQEDDVYDEEAIGGLYINKHFFKGTPQEGHKIRLVVEEVED